MSTNLSKQKRDDLLSKISAIRAYIAAAPCASFSAARAAVG